MPGGDIGDAECMMTTAERRILAEIEAGLWHDDPGFVQEFTDFARRNRRSTRQREIGLAWLVIGAAVLAFAWVLQSALAIVIGLSALSIALTWWLVPADTPDILAPHDDDPAHQAAGPDRGPLRVVRPTSGRSPQS
jgi:hypothetical protein